MAAGEVGGGVGVTNKQPNLSHDCITTNSSFSNKEKEFCLFYHQRIGINVLNGSFASLVPHPSWGLYTITWTVILHQASRIHRRNNSRGWSMEKSNEILDFWKGSFSAISSHTIHIAIHAGRVTSYVCGSFHWDWSTHFDRSSVHLIHRCSVHCYCL